VIEATLPSTVAAAEAGEDDPEIVLFAEEKAIVEGAGETRQREFTTGRDCAHRALERLGMAPQPVLAGGRGEPIWPTGIVGSISHCRGYRGCAVARAEDLVALGIDAEPHAPLPEGLLDRVAGPEELARLEELTRAEPSVCWDRLLFSAKEAVYKAWYPLAERRLGVAETMLAIDRRRRTFSARLLVPGPMVAGAELSAFPGRWLIGDGLVLTAVAIGET
jgi:enterobactin synthetase component D / holo-[acyl-carrier protein] synthase